MILFEYDADPDKQGPAKAIGDDGRGGEIRTHDPLYPKQVRYQTAPRPDTSTSLGNWIGNEKAFSLAGERFFILSQAWMH